MEKMVPYRKLSKKEKRKIDEKRRVTWDFSPVTRKKENAKAYDRKKAKKWDGDVSNSLPSFFARNSVSTGCAAIRSRTTPCTDTILLLKP